MDELVQKLSKGDHKVTVSTHVKSPQDLKDMIERDYVLVKFTETRGGTELGYPLDKERSQLDGANYEDGSGEVLLVGNLNLNYVDVRCVAKIDLSTMEGLGHLEIMEEEK